MNGKYQEECDELHLESNSFLYYDNMLKEKLEVGDCVMVMDTPNPLHDSYTSHELKIILPDS